MFNIYGVGNNFVHIIYLKTHVNPKYLPFDAVFGILPLSLCFNLGFRDVDLIGDALSVVFECVILFLFDVLPGEVKDPFSFALFLVSFERALFEEDILRLIRSFSFEDWITKKQLLAVILLSSHKTIIVSFY